MPRPKPQEPYHHFHLRLPVSVWQRLLKCAQMLGLSQNATIIKLLDYALKVFFTKMPKEGGEDGRQQNSR